MAPAQLGRGRAEASGARPVGPGSARRCRDWDRARIDPPSQAEESCQCGRMRCHGRTAGLIGTGSGWRRRSRGAFHLRGRPEAALAAAPRRPSGGHPERSPWVARTGGAPGYFIGHATMSAVSSNRRPPVWTSPAGAGWNAFPSRVASGYRMPSGGGFGSPVGSGQPGELCGWPETDPERFSASRDRRRWV